jgi:N-acetylglucosaminyl-diphospho-decaprenol L-rhamnosyltransferase
MEKTNCPVSVLIVTFNNAKTIAECLDSVFAFLPKGGQIIVFDNASVDDTLEKLKKYHSRIIVIESPENVGFGRGNNLALKAAQGEYILLLNPDSKLMNNIFDISISFLKSHSDVALVGPKLLRPNGDTQPSVKKLPTLSGLIKEFYFHMKNEYQEYTPFTNDPYQTECVYGTAMVCKRDLFESIGGFNERYFLYYEDIDLCMRIRNLGKKVYYLPNALVQHHLGASGVKGQTKSRSQQILAHFIPLKSSGSYYYQVKGRYVYHGLVVGFLMSVLLFLAVKLHLWKV